MVVYLDERVARLDKRVRVWWVISGWVCVLRSYYAVGGVSGFVRDCDGGWGICPCLFLCVYCWVEVVVMASNRKPSLSAGKRVNWFGRDEGVYTDKWGHEIEVKYTKAGTRMRCTAFYETPRIRKGGKVRPPGQCGAWSEPQRDKCKDHGGRMLEARMARGMTVTGERSKYGLALKQKVDEYRGDKQLKSLTEEIAKVRGLLETEFERLSAITADDDDGLSRFPEGSDIRRLMSVVGELRKLIEAQDRLKYGAGYVPSVDQLQIFVNQVITIIRQEVKDPNVIGRIADRFTNLTLPDSCGIPESKRHKLLGVGK